MNVGIALQQARQQTGMSREQIAQSTKIQLAKIEALESNAFDRLPDGIYLDGIVKAYARTVGLDGDAMVERVHATLALRATEAADELAPTSTVAATDATYSHDHALAYPDIDSFDRGSGIAHDRGPAIAPRTAEADLRVHHDFLLPPPARRRSMRRFVLAVVVLLAAAGLGGYLYESSRRSENARAAGTTAVSSDRQDAARAGGGGGTGDTGAAGAGAAGDTGAAGATRAGGEAMTAASTDNPVASNTRRPAPEPRGAPAAPRSPVTPAPPPIDLSGFWTLDTRVESSSYRDFEGLQLGYRLELRQDGSRVSGTGVKTLENGRALGPVAQTPILIQGTVDGERLTLTFTERGIRRSSDGKMILDVNEDGVLRGRFSSNAAQSVGIVEARRTEG